MDVKHRKCYTISADFAVTGQQRLTVAYQGDIETGTAHIHGDHIVRAVAHSVLQCCFWTSCWTRHECSGTQSTSKVWGHNDIVRLHDQYNAIKPSIGKLLFDVCQVIAQFWPDESIKGRGAVAFVCADLR